MFEYIYTELFPVVGEWFGLVVGFSQISCNQFINFIAEGRLNFEYINILTGELLRFSSTGMVDIPIIGDLVEGALSLFMQVLFGNIDKTLPLWVGLPFALVDKFLILIVIKWGLDFIRQVANCSAWVFLLTDFKNRFGFSLAVLLTPPSLLGRGA